MNFWENLLEYLYMAVSAAMAFVSLLAFKRNNAVHWKVYSVFLCLFFIVECVAFYLSRMQIENHWLYNPVIAIEFLIQVYLFYHLLEKPNQKKIIIGYAAALFIFVFVNWFFLQPINRLQTNITVVGGVGSFIFSVFYCIQLYNSDSTIKITRDRGFWISAGFILNYAAVVPFMGMLNYLWENYKEFTYLYFVYVMNVIFIISNTTVVIAYLCPEKSRMKKEPVASIV